MCRPMYSRMLQKERSSEAFSVVANLAKAKLFGVVSSHDFGRNNAADQRVRRIEALIAFAVVSGLRIASLELAEKAMSSMQGVCLGVIVSDSRSTIDVLYPSEPVLANCAVAVLYQNRDWQIPIVAEHYLSSFDRGTIGECVFML